MKKIILLFATLGIAFSMEAQVFFAESNSDSPSNSNYNPQAIIWDQQPATPGGAVSTHSTPDDQGIYSSDDFNLTESTRIDKITLFGFQLEGNLDLFITGFDVYIYTNSVDNTPSGNPFQVGTGVVELRNISTLQTAPIAVEFIFDTEGNYTFVVDMALANGGNEVVLPAGDYWLVACPRLNISPPSEFVLRWTWYDGGVPNNGVNEAHAIDPEDTGGDGITEWTPLTDLGAPFGSTAFTIEGELISVGVNDIISELASVYPNPTNGILNVDMPSTVTVKSSSLFNELGQDTGIRLVNGTMNISDLAKGVYILNVETSAGTLNQNVIKN